MKKLILSLFTFSSVASFAIAATPFTIGTDFGDAAGEFNNSTIPFNTAGHGVTVSGWQSKGSGAFTALDSNAVAAGGMGDFMGTMRGEANVNDLGHDVFGLESDLTQAIADSTQHAFFEITIPENVFLDLTSMEFVFRSAGGGGGRNLAVATTLDGFVFSDTGPGRNDDPNISPQIVALSGAAYEGVTNTTVGVYFFGQRDSGSGNIDIDDIFVSGAVIPEPSTVGILLGIATLGFVVYRRRRRL